MGFIPGRVFEMLQSVTFVGFFQRAINRLFSQRVKGGSTDVDIVLVYNNIPVSQETSLLLSLRGASSPVIGESLPHEQVHALLKAKLEKAGLELVLLEDLASAKQVVYTVRMPFALLAKTAQDLELQVRTKKGLLVPFTIDAAQKDILRDFEPSRVYFSSFVRQQACEAVMCADKTADGRSLLPLLVHEGLLEYYPVHDPVALDRILQQFTKAPASAIGEITEYFGTSRGFYFAWIDQYTQSLYVPAVLGLLVYLVQAGQYKEMSWTMVVYMVALAIWSSLFLETWKRRSAELAYTWGVLDYGSMEKRAEPQPIFHGTLRESPITGKPELYEDDRVRYKRYLVTWPASLACVVGAGGLMWVCFLLEDLAKSAGEKNYFSSSVLNDYLHFIPHFAYVIAIPILNSYYQQLAKDMTVWENHRLESSYQQHLVLKLTFFVATNSYLSLLYCMFWVRDLERLRVQFGSLMLTTQFSGSLIENGPHLLNKAKAWWASRDAAQVSVMSSSCHRCTKPLILAPSDHGLRQHPCDVCSKERAPKAKVYLCVTCETQVCNRCYMGDNDEKGISDDLESTPDLFDEYIEIVLQFGYISFFGWCWPLASMCCLLNNVLEIRTDFFKLIVSRRPLPRHSGGIGIYQSVMEFLSMAAVVTNFASLGVYLFYLHEGQLFDPSLISNSTLAVLLLLAEHALIFLKVAVEKIIPDVPQWITDTVEKEKYEADQLIQRVQMEQAQAEAEAQQVEVLRIEETEEEENIRRRKNSLPPVVKLVLAKAPEKKKKHWWQRIGGSSKGSKKS